MAGADGDARADLIARLQRDPAAADFFQAVRVLAHAPQPAPAATDAPPAGAGGEDARSAAGPVRFRAAVGLRHAATEIVRAEPGAPPELTVGFLGLTGPAGVLPDHYSELLVGQRRAREAGAGDFFDLFNHRLVSLFHAAWVKYRLPVQWEAAQRAGRADPVSGVLASLMGLGLPAQRAGLAGQGSQLLTLAGPLSRKVRSAGVVRRLAHALTGLPAEVRELQGAWITIPAHEQSRLGGDYARLGADAVAGARAYDVQSRVRVRLGPMGLSDFRSFFQPDGPRGGLHRGLRLALGAAVDYDLQLILRRAEAPVLRLAREGADPALLGQTTWLPQAGPGPDREDAVLASGPGPAASPDAASPDAAPAVAAES